MQSYLSPMIIYADSIPFSSLLSLAINNFLSEINDYRRCICTSAFYGQTGHEICIRHQFLSRDLLRKRDKFRISCDSGSSHVLLFRICCMQDTRPPVSPYKVSRLTWPLLQGKKHLADVGFSYLELYTFSILCRTRLCCISQLWLGLVSLFNGISTFVVYLMPKLYL